MFPYASVCYVSQLHIMDDILLFLKITFQQNINASHTPYSFGDSFYYI